MRERRLLLNAAMSVVQIIIAGSVLFILYRFLLMTIGIEQLGLWSLVLSTTSITHFANLGFSGSVTKFVAQSVARGEKEKVSRLIQTATLSVAAFSGLILLIFYPFAIWILKIVVSDPLIPLAISILPYSFLALWFSLVCSIFQGGLDGFQRIDIRSLLLIGGAVLHLTLCLLFAPLHGLLGVAFARAIQSIILLICSWLLIRKQLRVLPNFPCKWDKEIFKKMLLYGANLQAISVTNMLYEPVTKVLLTRFGGLAMTGYYEMASRMVQQFRAIIVSANQVLVPLIAVLKEKNPDKIQSVYSVAYRLIFYISLPLYALIIISTPIISKIWLGNYEKTFVVFGILLSIGWFLNTLNVPAYFANLGIGRLGWNLTGHIAIALLNFVLGFLMGMSFGGIGVVIAWVISLAFGSSLIYLSFHLINRIPLSELIPNESIVLLGACFFGILSTTLIYENLRNSIDLNILNPMSIASFSLIVFLPLWFHPMRTHLKSWLFAAFKEESKSNEPKKILLKSF